MHLLEHTSKGWFARYGIAVPTGALWPQLPAGEAGFVIKAQVRRGGRGKNGGVQFAPDAAAAAACAERLRYAHIGDEPVEAVYIEDHVLNEREVYVAFSVDRDRGAVVLLVSPDGGVDIESVTRERLCVIPLDSLLGLQPFHVTRACRFLELGSVHVPAVERIIAALYELMLGEDALLVEINPLALLAGGGAVALDAKISLDDAAVHRHSDRTVTGVPVAANLERALGAAGAAAVELDADGDVIVVVSGAGLMMATVDMLRDAGVRLHAAVDLGGAPLADGSALQRILETVLAAQPRLVFVNAFLHTSSCDQFATRVVAALGACRPTDVIVRLRGRGADDARRLLNDARCRVHHDLAHAIRDVVYCALAHA